VGITQMNVQYCTLAVQEGDSIVRRLAFAFLCLSWVMAGQEPPKPSVTFYSAGCTACLKDALKADVGISFQRAFFGPVYDGDEPLVKIMQPDHFVTFRLNAGPHTFTGRKAASKSDKNQTLSLDMEPGKHYYVRLAMKDSGVWAVRFQTPILLPVECSEAVTEGAKMKPLKMRKPDPKHPVDVVETPSVPACEGVGTRSGIAE